MGNQTVDVPSDFSPLEVNGDQLLDSHFLQNINIRKILENIRRKLIQVWNNIRVRKLFLGELSL